jgi:hypothetical protein
MRCKWTTSALIKWYVSESNSNEVEAFLTGDEQLVLNGLAMLEWDCTIANAHTDQMCVTGFWTGINSPHSTVGGKIFPVCLN